MYVQVNIGRNVEESPMSAERWDEFINHAIMVVTDAANGDKLKANKAIEVHRGNGNWDGVPEDSAHISLFWADGFDLVGLRAYLRILKQLYVQDNIALITSSELI